MLHVTLRQLEYVVAVARIGSLSAAAEHLHVSQPALSVAIAHVEARIGATLFQRRKGVPLAPTDFGRLFVTDAEVLLRDAARLEQPGGLAKRIQSRVTLGILNELAPAWLAPILHHLRNNFPETEISTLTADFETLRDALAAGRVNLALTYDLDLDATFHRDLFLRAAPRAWVSANDRLVGRKDVSLAELADRPLILSDQDLSIRHMLGLFRQIGATPTVKHRASSIELLRSLAANDEGVGLSYTNPMGDLSEDGKSIERLKITDAFALEPVVLVYMGPQPTPLTEIREAICNLGAGRSD